MIKHIRLRKELAYILIIKTMILIAIKIIWFSDTTENIEQATTERFLGKPNSTISQEGPQNAN